MKMAAAARLTPTAFICVNAKPKNTKNKITTGKVNANANANGFGLVGRRDLFLALTVVAVDSRTELLDKYLKKSQENKAKNDKERLDSYYNRNYKDYFESMEGALRQRDEKDLSESDKAILEWLDANRQKK